MITYPLAFPTVLARTFAALSFTPTTVVGKTRGTFSLTTQTFVWAGQAWAGKATLPPLQGLNADAWEAFLLALNGVEGSFYLGDTSRPTTRGTATGSWTVGTGATANSTVLPITGTGAFAVGDWLQVGRWLHRVINIVDATHVDVWPRLRTAYASGTSIVYTNAVGQFCLADNSDMAWDIDTPGNRSINFNFIEDL